MKRTLCFCALFLAALPSVRAQDTPEPRKDTVLVDFFLRNRTVPMPYAETFRGHILDGFADRGRHVLVDAAASPELSAGLPGSGLTTPETAAADLAAFLGQRAPQAVRTGARYLVGGAVTDYRFEHVQLPASDSKKPPRAGFKASFRVLLSAFDLKFGEALPDATYLLTATAPVAEDADRAALAKIRGSLEYYIDNNFKFETAILELCPPDRKGRVRELYIHCGTEMGVKPGDLFMVYEEVAVGGVPARRKIGRLRVNEVQNPTVARCKIAKGDAEIAGAFAAGRSLTCVSDGEAFFH